MKIMEFILQYWTQIGTAAACITMVLAMFDRLFFRQFESYIEGFIGKLVEKLDPYVKITFHEFYDGHKDQEAYNTIKSYFTANCSKTARRLKAIVDRDILFPAFNIESDQEVSDEFNGVVVWWISGQVDAKSDLSTRPQRFFRLTFLKKHRQLITGDYLKHVMTAGKAVIDGNRELKLYTYNGGERSYYGGPQWTAISIFEHPMTLESLAMEKKKKEDIIKDLTEFSKAKEYYRRIGKPWRRGYLLYGPPGTGKSSMIAAMSNMLKYDVYDLELTSIKSNTELKRLLVSTPSKSIVVIEDIDCLLGLTGDRAKKKKENEEDQNITLSGLLNAVDGLYSATEGERLMIFTTNHVKKLDVAFIRKGRMDKHIEMSFCGYESFEILAKNYLGIDNHALFPEIEQLLQDINIDITPADVAEILNTKVNPEESGDGNEKNGDVPLQNLIRELKRQKAK